jgi:hypothetical protein
MAPLFISVLSMMCSDTNDKINAGLGDFDKKIDLDSTVTAIKYFNFRLFISFRVGRQEYRIVLTIN